MQKASSCCAHLGVETQEALPVCMQGLLVFSWTGHITQHNQGVPRICFQAGFSALPFQASCILQRVSMTKSHGCCCSSSLLPGRYLRAEEKPCACYQLCHSLCSPKQPKCSLVYAVLLAPQALKMDKLQHLWDKWSILTRQDTQIKKNMGIGPQEVLHERYRKLRFAPFGVTGVQFLRSW